MGKLSIIPTAATPFERVLSRFDRAELEGFIAVAIGLLDLADGDPDLEPSGFLEDHATYLRCAEHRDAAAYLATQEDDEDDEPLEDDGTAEDSDVSEDDDPAEDDTEDRCVAGDDGCGPVIVNNQVLWGAKEDQ